MILLENNEKFINDPFEKEIELEKSIISLQKEIFGENRIYINTKKLIGDRNRKQNIPDGYLLDLSNNRNPILYVVEVELASHDPLRHIAIQLLEFSLSYEASKQKIKEIIKKSIREESDSLNRCNDFIQRNSYENLDYLLEKVIYREKDAFNALVIIDEYDSYLEQVLGNKFKFPIEMIIVERFKSASGKKIYKFEPFLQEVIDINSSTQEIISAEIDPENTDTIIVPAQEEGFQDTFIGEDCWYAIRINRNMLQKIKYIAAYRVAPTSAITHVAEIEKIEQYENTNKYILYFKEKAKEINEKKLVSGGTVKAPQGPRYALYEKLIRATNLDEVFS